jgi:hypothetical protein
MTLGFKDFVAGDVLTAAQVDGYLMRQTVMVFASDAARDTALSGNLEEGMHCYTEDNNREYVYTGAAWEILSEPTQTWTATVTQGSAVSGTQSIGRYQRSRGWFRAIMVWTSTGAGTTAQPIVISLPVTLNSASAVSGFGTIVDDDGNPSGPTANSNLVHVRPDTTTSIHLVKDAGTGVIGDDVGPAGSTYIIAADDVIYLEVTGTY